MNNAIQIGVIEGQGTGYELVEYFKTIIKQICLKENRATPRFISFKDFYGYSFDSYFSMKERGEFLPSQQKQLNDLQTFFKTLCENKVKGVFQSAIDAEVLYNFRAEQKFLKYLPFTIKNNNLVKRILFARDMCQGFYANKKVKKYRDHIQVEAGFNLEDLLSICKFLKHKVQSESKEPDEVIFIYKYHLFGQKLEDLITKASIKSGISKTKIKLVQPDTGIQYLFDTIWKNQSQSICLICGNEIGDMLLEMLGYYYNIGNKESLFSVNYPLQNPSLEFLQTVHGSADNLAGTDQLDPTSLIKLSAYALQNWLGIDSATIKMQRLIKEEKKQIISDIGTQAYINSIINRWP